MLPSLQRVEFEGYASVIEQHMTVRADAKQIVASVIAIMRTTKRLDMMSLAITTTT